MAYTYLYMSDLKLIANHIKTMNKELDRTKQEKLNTIKEDIKRIKKNIELEKNQKKQINGNIRKTCERKMKN